MDIIFLPLYIESASCEYLRSHEAQLDPLLGPFLFLAIAKSR